VRPRTRKRNGRGRWSLGSITRPAAAGLVRDTSRAAPRREPAHVSHLRPIYHFRLNTVLVALRVIAASSVIAAVLTWAFTLTWKSAREPAKTLSERPIEYGPTPSTKDDHKLRSAEVQRRDLMLEPPYVVLDSTTFAAGLQEVRLGSIEGPHRDAVCKDSEGFRWACGLRARAALHNLLKGAILSCRVEGEAGGPRVKAFCSAEGQDIGEALVRNGWARPTSQLHGLELEEAQRDGMGLWNGNWSIEPPR
jgi:endonuclease YncB( thermonuclease family)